LYILKELEARRVSMIAMNGLTFHLSTPHGRMMATIIAGIADFERGIPNTSAGKGRHDHG